jgi:serine phosphatase RsbU (regulator of sigma subunit)
MCLCFSKAVTAQEGNYFMHNYLPSQYLASDQNRCIIQDKYGRILVANNDGVLVNNGTDWLTLKLEFLCLSLAKNDKEDIYVGGDGNFGKLTRKDNGEFKFESLKPLLPTGEKEVNKIWSILVIKDHVYFCSNQKIFDYWKDKIATISPGEEGFHTFFKVGDHLVVKERGAGLKFLSYNNQLTLFRGGDVFADNAAPVRGIVAANKKQYIISPKGVFECDYNNSLPEVSEIKKVSTALDTWLADKTVYCAANIGEDHLAFGSVSGGLVITNLKFEPLKYINSGNELQDDGVNYIYNDYQGHIWLALAKGVSLIEFNNPITKFTKVDGIKGTVEGCISYNGTLYIATDKGVLRFDHSTDNFESTNITDVAWCLKEINGELIAGTKFGLYRLDKNEFTFVLETPSDPHCMLVAPTKNNESIVYVGTETGYAKLLFSNRSFKVLKEAYDLNETIRTMARDELGFVYMGTFSKGVLMLNGANDQMVALTEKTKFDKEAESGVLRFQNEIFVFNGGKVYSIINNKDQPAIVNAEAFSNLTRNYYFLNAQMVVKDEIWINYRKSEFAPEGLMCLQKRGNVFVVKPSQLSRIKESDSKSMCFNDSNVYVGTNNGLYCYNTKLVSSGQVLNTFLNKVKFGRDSVSYLYNINPNMKTNSIELDYKNNSIEVYPGASDFIDKNELLFSYYLEGLENGYNQFANKKVINYDYLHEGNYILHVRSMNILGKEGQEIHVPFTVLPPWYRTIWAYIAYVLAFGLCVFAIIKLYAKRLIEQNLRLEKIIADRTREIQKQKHEIEHKNQEITDSINYAKGIQDSILPEISDIKNCWKDLFVFFQPKDIVSGDFYWFKKINDDEFLIACCDCTGHGVPGGFMSMICSGKLHDAATITTEPDKVLFHANNSIKENLRQQGTSKNKDGMEICLLKVNTRTREVKYSGANRALWVYDASQNTLNEIKPTKASIASSTEFNSNYEVHTLHLDPGDIVYAQSDGYADQFGGASGKKYMTKNFKAYLLSNVKLSMDDQGRELKDNINAWMGKHEQVDDLLVIGVKL